jgi:hypothetical protein
VYQTTKARLLCQSTEKGAFMQQLKSLAETRNYEALREIRDGQYTNETEYRRIMGMQGRKVLFRMSNGKYISQQLPRKELCFFDGKTLIIYAAGFRKTTPDEDAFIKNWMEKVRKLRLQNPSLNIQVFKQDYFREHGYEYLLGQKKIKGKRFDWKSHLVEDESIPGQMLYLYRLRPCS